MRYILLFLLSLTAISAFSQSKLPVIKASSKNVSINDGGYLDKNAWTLSPKTKLDIFTADRTRKTKWVTFYTDIDSIRVKVKPGTRFTFVILLNGKDSCYTQIASAIPPENGSKISDKHDTIPFILSPFDAIQVKAIVNNTDTLNFHFDIGSSDFRLTRDAILHKTNLLSNQPDALAGKNAPDYNKLNKVFKIQIGPLIWNDPAVGTTQLTAHGMDGRFGWNLFEGKIIEIDYDHNLLIIHHKPFKISNGYIKSNLEFLRSFIGAKGSIEIADKKYSGDFIFDTGSEQAIILDSAWVSKQNFSQNLKVIRSLILHNPRGDAFETKIVNIPLFKINGFELSNIPILMLSRKNPAGFEVNDLGNGFLKRFNMILDLKNDRLYLKPNKLMNSPYREKS